MCKSPVYLLLIFLIIINLEDATGFKRPWKHESHEKHDPGSRSSRSHGSHSPEGFHKKHSTFRVPRAKMMMPSGNFYYITYPSDSKKWDCDKKSKLRTLSPTGKMSKKEYEIVKNEVEMTWGTDWTSSGHQILKIQKIDNSCLWNKYKYRKSQVLKEAGVTNEQMLFHGSPAIMQLVEKGFDERYAKLTGNYGAGVYFASHPSKSHYFTSNQADGSRLLLLCRVTLGKIQVLHAGSNLAHAPVGFNSVKGDMTQPEYVIYRGEQAYPEYLITYK